MSKVEIIWNIVKNCLLNALLITFADVIETNQRYYLVGPLKPNKKYYDFKKLNE